MQNQASPNGSAVEIGEPAYGDKSEGLNFEDPRHIVLSGKYSATRVCLVRRKTNVLGAEAFSECGRNVRGACRVGRNVVDCVHLELDSLV